MRPFGKRAAACDGGETTSIAGADTVRGERGIATVNRVRSVESRVTAALAVGLMTALGLGMLAWYYTNAVTRPARARRTAQAMAASHAQGDVTLLSLGRIDPPESLVAARELPLQPSPITSGTAGTFSVSAGEPAAGFGAPPNKNPAQLALQRRLSGTAFARFSNDATSDGGGSQIAGANQQDSTGSASIAGGPFPAAAMPALAKPSMREMQAIPASAMSAMPTINPTNNAANNSPIQARILPTRRMLLPKGAFIDCTLETAIDSSLPGMTTCIVATDTFSVDGKVVLLERGTKLVGETRGQAQLGSSRVYVLWTEARTPTGVVIPLASPGTDELGRSGLPGTVDRHFWERFGAAILVSTLDGAVQAAVRSSNSGSGTVIYNPSGTQDVMSEVLKSTINIAPTIVKRQGDRIQVLVAQDLDFRPVYELHALDALH